MILRFPSSDRPTMLNLLHRGVFGNPCKLRNSAVHLARISEPSSSRLHGVDWGGRTTATALEWKWSRCGRTYIGRIGEEQPSDDINTRCDSSREKANRGLGLFSALALLVRFLGRVLLVIASALFDLSCLALGRSRLRLQDLESTEQVSCYLPPSSCSAQYADGDIVWQGPPQRF